MKRAIKDEFLDDMAKLHKKIADITLVDGTKISGEELRLEHQKYGKGGRITSLDLIEARQFFGEDDWKKLSKEDRINSAKYLKRTGKIGYKKGGKVSQPAPQPMESQEFYSAMQYDKGGEMKSKWYVVSAKYDKVVSKGFNSEEEAKKSMYELYEKNKDFSLATRKMADGGMMAEGGRVRSKYIVTYDDGDDISKVWVYANNEQDAKEQALEEYSDIKDIISVEKMMADGGMMDYGDIQEKINNILSSNKNTELNTFIKPVDFILNQAFAEDVDIDTIQHEVEKEIEFQIERSNYNKELRLIFAKIIVILKNASADYMADGGKVTDKEVADSNVEMLHSNIKSIKHHAEELENAVKDSSIEIEGWVLAKADRAATAMSDITHYLDGRKMGNGGMVGGYYYKDKNGEDLRYVGPDSKDVNIGIFKAGDKYLQKPYTDFEQEPKNNNKLFGWFGNGGYMPKGTNRKLTIAEKAEEMVGKNTWNELDAITKEGVIQDLISDGALAVTMESGGILSSNDWDKASTDEKIYAIKKAGYSNNMASEMSILPYEQLPMWVREDFKKGAIVIGGYHIHKNRLSSPVPLKLGIYLVFNGDEEVVFSAETLEEAKNKIMNENPNYESEELIEWVFLDEHDGADWKYEPVLQSS
jgi:hypothetical protein